MIYRRCSLTGHRAEVMLVKWNEPYQKLATCDANGIIFVWIKYVIREDRGDIAAARYTFFLPMQPGALSRFVDCKLRGHVLDEHSRIHFFLSSHLYKRVCPLL